LEGAFAGIAGAEADARRSPDVDYDVYADGEAPLGWFNATWRIDASTPFDGNALLLDLARDVKRTMNGLGLEIAHLKMTLTPDDEIGDLAVVNLVSSDGEPERSHQLHEDVAAGELIVNLRAAGDPEI